MFSSRKFSVLVLCAACVRVITSVELVIDAGSDNDASSYTAVVAGGVNTGPGIGLYYSTVGVGQDVKFLEQFQVNFGADYTTSSTPTLLSDGLSQLDIKQITWLSKDKAVVSGTTSSASATYGDSAFIFLTQDGGRSWTKAPTCSFNPGVTDTVLGSENQYFADNSLAISGEQVVCLSNNSAASWVAVDVIVGTGGQSAFPSAVSIAPTLSAGGQVVVRAIDCNGTIFVCEIYRLTTMTINPTSGAISNVVYRSLVCTGNMFSTVSFLYFHTNGLLGMYGCASTSPSTQTVVYVTTDGGVTWSPDQTTYNAVHYLLAPTCPTSTTCYLVQDSGGVIYKATSAAWTTFQLLVTLPVSNLTSFSGAPRQVYMSGQLRSPMACLSTTTCTLVGYEAYSTAAYYQGFIVLTTDGWSTYKFINPTPNYMPIRGYLISASVNSYTNSFTLTGVRGTILNMSATGDLQTLAPLITRQGSTGGASFSDGTTLLFTASGVATSTNFGSAGSWTSEKALSNKIPSTGYYNTTIQSAVAFSKSSWLLATAETSIVVSAALSATFSFAITRHRVSVTTDAGASFQELCTVYTLPAVGGYVDGTKVPSTRMLKLHYTRGSNMDPTVFIVHPFALYNYTSITRSGSVYPDNSCGNLMHSLTPPIPYQSSVATYGDQIAAIGCSPALGRGCIMMTVNWKYTTAASLANALSTTYITSTMTLKSDCGTAGVFSTTLYSATAMTGSGVIFNSDVLYGSSANVLAYTSSLRDALFTSVDGGTTWVWQSLTSIAATLIPTNAVFHSPNVAFISTMDTATATAEAAQFIRITYYAGTTSFTPHTLNSVGSFVSYARVFSGTSLIFPTRFFPVYESAPAQSCLQALPATSLDATVTATSAATPSNSPSAAVTSSMTGSNSITPSATPSGSPSFSPLALSNSATSSVSSSTTPSVSPSTPPSVSPSTPPSFSPSTTPSQSVSTISTSTPSTTPQPTQPAGVSVPGFQLIGLGVGQHWVRERSVDSTSNQLSSFENYITIGDGFESCYSVPSDGNIGRIRVPIAGNSTGAPGSPSSMVRVTVIPLDSNQSYGASAASQASITWVMNRFPTAPSFTYVKVEVGARVGVPVSNGVTGVCVRVEVLAPNGQYAPFVVPLVPLSVPVRTFGWTLITSGIPLHNGGNVTVVSGSSFLGSRQIPMIIHALVPTDD